MFVIPYPVINPVIYEIGPFAIRWYALAYIAGLLLGWRYCLRLASRPPEVAGRQDIDDFLVWATLGVVIGGRSFYVLFYDLPKYLGDPLEIFKVWHGGMSFHGGAFGVMAALLWFCRARAIPLLSFADLIACAAPIGLFFGRIANFINSELWGRVSDLPWAMRLPGGGPARHPSQLYEGALEGIVLFLALFLLRRHTKAAMHPGLLTGVFLAG
ncbi:MAG TPA: prolipoprotein diacylglyceryl transferase, partial [Stellaceae bacterium]|nr:prolipoprotein diacylglyceryl transferase [Stellaceae bacterium]